MEFGGIGKVKRGKKEKKERVRVCVWRIKKEGKKRKKRRNWMKKNKEIRD